jgi:tetraacyldisaccharide 4'-kinase
MKARYLLVPLSLVYGMIVCIRNFCFDYGILPSRYFSFPVISVGNITVGGTGKTPHVEYLIKLLLPIYKVAVLSRGYKRKTKGFHLATELSASHEIGDEPLQIKKKFPDAEVAVHEKRVQGIKMLIRRKIDLILLDDAFQHRYVKPGLSILLIDYNRPIDQDMLLPAGNLRESQSGMKRADILVITKTPLELKPIERRLILEKIKPAPYQDIYFSGFKYGTIQPVFQTKSNIFQEFQKNHSIYTILLVTGLANSKPLVDKLKEFTNDIRHLKYSDHTEYSLAHVEKIAKEFNQIENGKKIILTTEKDAVKIRESGYTNQTMISNMFYIPIDVVFIEKEEEFNQQIFNYVNSNKRNN